MRFSGTTTLFFISCLFFVVFLAGFNFSEATLGVTNINGAGSSLAYNIFTQWQFLYSLVRDDLAMTYTATGSGAGTTALLAHTIDFAGSDGIPTDAQFAQGIEAYPMIGSPIVMVYNLPFTNQLSHGSLILDRKAIVEMYLGIITKWDDPYLLQLNQNVSDVYALLTAAAGVTITLVRRSDSSGSTFIFTNALNSFSPLWNQTVNPPTGTTINWPYTTVAQSGGSGIINYVKGNTYSIGYVGWSDAIASNVYYSQIINKAGALLSPTAAAVQSAMTDFQSNLDTSPHLAAVIVDGSSPGSWPLSGFSYLLLFTNQSNCDQGKGLLDWMIWVQVTPGAQTTAGNLGYSTLASGVLKRMVDKLSSVQCADGERPLTKAVIIGSGSTLAFNAITTWARFYKREVPNTIVDYLGVGSGKGISDIIANNTDFGGTDAVLTDAQYTAGGDLQLLPVLGAAISLVYNVPGITTRRSYDYTQGKEVRVATEPLVLNSTAIAGIFTNKITVWDDPILVDLNPLLSLPHQNITIVVRQESSGTSEVFSTYLSRVSPLFASAVGNSTTPAWSNILPSFLTAKGGNGIITTVSANAYSLGYVVGVDYLAASQTNIGLASMINPAGSTVIANFSTIQSAMLDFQSALSSTLTSDLLNGPSPLSWPITAYSYAIIRTTSYSDCAKATALLDFITWSQTSSTALAVVNELGYAVTPPAIRRSLLEKMATITCKGQIIFSLAGCLQNGDVCSDNGECIDNACVCVSGFEGTYCDKVVDKSQSSDNTGTIIGAVLGSVLGTLFLCCILCLFIIILVVAVLIARSGRRYNRLDKMWLVEWSDLEVGQQIGAGANGAVHHATWKGVEVAVKVLGGSVLGEDGKEVASTVAINKQLKEQFIEEASLMTTLRHPNVVLFMGACANPPAIIMSYMKMGSLYDVLHNEFIANIPNQRRLKMALQAAQGMFYLHSLDIIHRDLKSLNLLIDEDWNVKISDFGLTKFKEQLEEMKKERSRPGEDEHAMSIYWTAPEIFEDSTAYSAASDVYSYGIILWEIATRKNPYEGMSPAAVAVAVVRDQSRPPLPEDSDLPEEYPELITNCWEQEPADRPDFQEIVSRLQVLTHVSKSNTAEDDDASFYSTRADERSRQGSKTMDSSTGQELIEYQAETGVAPPQGNMALVFSDIHRAAGLWEAKPAAMKEATELHNAILREAMEEYGGYEVALMLEQGGIGGEGSFCVAFQKPGKALAWCAAVQESLLAADWPKELLQHEAAAEENDNQDDVMFRGLRVRMGANWGSPRAVRDALTRRIEFIGVSVNVAARLATIAQGGQILISQDLHDKVKNKDSVLKKGQLLKLGKFHAGDSEGNDESNLIFEYKPASLKARFFGGVTKTEKKEKEKKKGSEMSFTDSNEDSVVELGDNPQHQEDSYLTSANLCRWVINYKQLQMEKKIGSGSYGMVYRAKWKGVDVAVKRLIKQRLSEKDMLDFRAETAMLSELRHPNIVMFIGASLRPPNLCIVTEYMAKGSLREVLRDKSVTLDWGMKVKIGRSIALALTYLHSLKPIIIHRDLKPSNVLIDENWNVKLGDFGFARIKQENCAMTRCGTPCYTAPEIIKGEKYDESVDIYSFGMILWELLTRMKPYEGQNFMATTMDVLKGIRPAIPPKTPSEYAKIVKKCWSSEARKRPSLDTIVKYFEGESGGDENV